MFKMSCPRDKTPLSAVREGELLSHRCARCEGRAITISALRRCAIEGIDRRIWQAARGDGLPQGVRCPSCGRPSVAVRTADAEGEPLEVDVCRPCALIWLDGGERERVSAPLAPQDPLQAARDAAAAEVLAVAQGTRRPSASNDPAQRALARRFGVPDAPETLDESDVAPLSLGVGVAVALCALVSIGRWDEVSARFGLVPRCMGRPDEALRWLTHPFASTEPYLDVMIAIVLMIPGSALERVWGPTRLTLALGLAALGGGVAHTLLDPYPDHAVGGAFALVSAVFVLLWLELPQAVFVWRGESSGQTPTPRSLTARVQDASSVTLTPLRLLVFWALLHLGVWTLRRQPEAPLIHLSPWLGLGGAIAGLLAWFTLRPPPSRRRAAP